MTLAAPEQPAVQAPTIQAQAAEHLPYIDAVRGYAVLLVILSHTVYLFPKQPYAVHRLAVLGWHGVQLFFLASALTLMLSWQREAARGGTVDIGAFFLRRYFRIAPAYYTAGVIYSLLQPPPGGCDPGQIVAAALFLNAWHPVWMGLVSQGWSVVPGGWSIGVEFTFYAAFPMLAVLVTTPLRALALFGLTVAAGATANAASLLHLSQAFGQTATDNFLYFWFPNQFCVFALGLCLHQLIMRDTPVRRAADRHPAEIAFLSIGLCCGLAFLPLPQWLSWPAPPRFLLVSLCLAAFILALSRVRAGLFVNPAAAFVGRVSFSAYLSHFAILKILSGQALLQPVFALAGWRAVLALVATYCGIVAVVVVVSFVSFHLVEQPGMRFGRMVIRRRPLRAMLGAA